MAFQQRACNTLLLLGILVVPGYLNAQNPIVRGHLIDAAGGTPIAAASVRLAETNVRTLTDSSGAFVLKDVAPGNYTLEIEHVGYGVRQRPLEVPKTTSLSLTIRLDPKPTKLAGIEVKAISAEEWLRRAEGTKRNVITETVIEAAVETGRDLASVLRTHAPALRIQEGDFTIAGGTNPAHMLCVAQRGRGIDSFQKTRSAALGQYQNCDMVPVFLDGVRINDPGVYLRDAFLGGFAQIEWLSAIAASTRFGLQTENKGVLLLTTKSGKPK